MACDQRCDFNKDGKVDDADKSIMVSAYRSKIGDSNWNPACDLNGDGVIDLLDAALFGQSYGCVFGTEHITSVNIPTGATLKVDGVEVI